MGIPFNIPPSLIAHLQEIQHEALENEGDLEAAVNEVEEGYEKFGWIKGVLVSNYSSMRNAEFPNLFDPRPPCLDNEHSATPKNSSLP